ncbi:hypothetical protein LMG28140_03299 [Paraburkholderia metrosideri]|uniref:TnsA-like heteromeric transposase endonuclease subunit n=2 Tax=Paraburkholderia metrosideri TaxID=580937 RepID=A0ABM8NQQ3_9BURK|nr:hypothetical protein LMG28140_03299 [Paraburkholderia metrosideri]
MTGDCSHLSFSRARGERLRGLAIASGLRKTEWYPWSMRVMLPRDCDIEQPDADEPAHGSGSWLRGLRGSPVLQWPIAMSERDPRGVLRAPNFECWKKASASRVGIAGYHFSFKAGGQVACHSSLEARLLAYFEMCPFVIEIRTQYPQWNREAFLAYCEEGRPFPVNELLTIDFMLTILIPGLPYPIYHGVSGKPSAHLQKKKVIRRHDRESGGLWEWGATHEIMTEKTVDDTEYESYRRMFEHMKYVELAELEHLGVDARVFAHDLLVTNATGNARRVVPMLGKRRGWDSDQSFRLLAVAIFLGYLKWDVRHLYAPWEPLRFVRP